MNKPVCLGLVVLEMSKTVMYGYLKPKYGKKKKQNYNTWIQIAL